MEANARALIEKLYRDIEKENHLAMGALEQRLERDLTSFADVLKKHEHKLDLLLKFSLSWQAVLTLVIVLMALYR